MRRSRTFGLRKCCDTTLAFWLPLVSRGWRRDTHVDIVGLGRDGPLSEERLAVLYDGHAEFG